jgi:hypothetical protein
MEIIDYTNRKELVNQQLLELSKSMPMKQINVNSEVYADEAD